VLFVKIIPKPGAWHDHFAVMPVTITSTNPDKSMTVTTAWLTTVERRFETNLSGTRQWQYRIKATEEMQL